MVEQLLKQQPFLVNEALEGFVSNETLEWSNHALSAVVKGSRGRSAPSS